MATQKNRYPATTGSGGFDFCTRRLPQAGIDKEKGENRHDKPKYEGPGGSNVKIEIITHPPKYQVFWEKVEDARQYRASHEKRRDKESPEKIGPRARDMNIEKALIKHREENEKDEKYPRLGIVTHRKPLLGHDPDEGYRDINIDEDIDKFPTTKDKPSKE